MKYYKEYLIPETIDHEELIYLLSIGSHVLVQYQRYQCGIIAAELVPVYAHFTNSNIFPLDCNNIELLKLRRLPIDFLNYSMYGAL